MARKEANPLVRLHIIILVLLVVLILLVGYVYLIKTATPEIASKPNGDRIIYASFHCENEKSIQAVFFNQKVELTLSDGRTMLLMQGLSASGTRYTNNDESFTFWNKGDTSFVEEGKNSTMTYLNCVETPQK